MNPKIELVFSEKELEMTPKFYRIVLGGETRVATADKTMEIADNMVKYHGGGIPDIKPCDQNGNLVETTDETNSAADSGKTADGLALLTAVYPRNPVDENVSQDSQPKQPKQLSTWNDTVVDEQAKNRIEKMHETLKSQGVNIDTTQQYFATGTRMASVGYATQRKREEDHFNQQLLSDAIEQLMDKVSNEIRRDVHLTAKEIAKLISIEDNKLCIKEHHLTDHAIQGITTRLKSPALGYLLGLRDRAYNESGLSGANHQMIERDLELMAEVLTHECNRAGDVEFKLRMREYPDDIYAALSPSFGVADAPMVMEQILHSMPKDARGSWTYNADTTHWSLRASIWTPTPVDEQAVGEPMEGFISLSSTDNGTGRFNGGGGINLIRCLNASIYSAGEGVSQIHKGKILFNVKSMIDKSLKAIHALCLAWGKAREEVVKVPEKITIETAIPGFWRHLLSGKDSEFAGVLPGKKENHIKALTKEYFDQRRNDKQLVKADFAQAFTHYIQNQDYMVRREGEMAAGNFVVSDTKFLCDLKDKE